MNHDRSVVILIAGSLLSASCDDSPTVLPPEGHHVVHIDTDAILPPELASVVIEGERPPLFDRLEIAVLAEGETVPAAERVRTYDVDEGDFTAGGASFTIPAPVGARPKLRARLFRGESVYAGELLLETTIEVWAELPETPLEGAVDTTLYLLTDDVGVPQGSLADPLVASDAPDARVRPGLPGATLVGTWPGAVRRACAEPARPGEVCVPGGAYWMGNPLVKGDDFVESDRQRLVVLSPFYLDTKEVTVGELRAFAESTADPVEVTQRDPDPSSEAHFCTFTPSPDATSEARPANCVSWETAERYCESRGATLPTEAQFEYVSGQLRSALYIWGQDEAAVCEAAVWGRGGRPATAIASAGASNCLPPEPTDDGPLALLDSNVDKTRYTDRIVIDGTMVFDLAGNLQEWTRDWFSGQGNPCWSRPDTNVFVDPVCNDPGTLASRSVRGGSWIQDRVFLRAAYRAARAPEASQRYLVGFRCARPSS